jgi:UDP-N-acetylmuramyl tripeptide synthase
LRHPAVDFAVLEVARGGMLRRGLAVDRARAAIVTNVSADHFGEFGIDSVTDLADAKLTVARVLGEGGLLVLNGDDSLLLQRGRRIVAEMPPPQPALGLFAADFRHQELAAHRAAGGASCGASDGRLWLSQGFAAAVDLGAVALMPLSLGGSATYNISNIAAAALASAACGIPPAVIALVLAGFGATNQDNPGRLERWTIGQAEILLDYAHNPDGLTALLRVAAGLRRGGRLGLVMGQAGNRSDAEIRQLAKAVVAFAPDLVLLKDEPGMLRGRAAGAVPALLRETLLADGLEPTRVHVLLDEVDAAASLLAWSRPGDVAVLSVHGKDSRPRLRGMLDLLQSLA